MTITTNGPAADTKGTALTTTLPSPPPSAPAASPSAQPPVSQPPVLGKDKDKDKKAKDTNEIKGSIEQPEYPVSRPSLPDPNFIDPTLLYILTQPRSHDTASEKRFGTWLIGQLNKMKAKPTLRTFDNITVEIGNGKTLYSCHIDTCHGKAEQFPYKLVYDPTFEHLMLAEEVEPWKEGDPAWKKDRKVKAAGCLGADDGAGVWLMLKMIEAKIPGGYIFHRGEECGGLGSKAMLSKEAEWVKKFTACVAFDRAKDFEVITTQGGQICASQDYGVALSNALSWPEMAIKYETSTLGSFTDSKTYRGIVSECVNIAVGYYHQHTSDEYLDYGHLYALLDRIKTVKWDELPRSRKPDASETYGSGYRGGRHSGGGYQGGYGGGYPGYQGRTFDGEYDDGFGGESTHTGGGAKNTSPFPKGAAVGAGKPVAKIVPRGEEGPVMPEFDSHLEEMYETISDTDALITWFESDPEDAARQLMRAIVEGRSAELRNEMFAAKFFK